MLLALGFIVHRIKSDLVPRQSDGEFLGAIVDLRPEVMCFRLPGKKRRALKNSCRKLLLASKPLSPRESLTGSTPKSSASSNFVQTARTSSGSWAESSSTIASVAILLQTSKQSDLNELTNLNLLTRVPTYDQNDSN